MIHHVIYLPGLGDKVVGSPQALVSNLWRIFGVTTHYHYIGWSSKSMYAKKLGRVLSEVDKLVGQGHTVSLVGISAGASLALNVFAARKSVLHKVILICGKIKNPQTISNDYYTKNPSFKVSVAQLPHSLGSLSPSNKKQILCIKPLWDGVIATKDMVIDGAPFKTIVGFGHTVSIALAITIYSRSIATFIKSDSPRN